MTLETDTAGRLEQMGRSLRRLRWAMVVSLGINLLVLGAVAGAYLAGGAPAPRHMDMRGAGPASFMGALRAGDRRAIAEMMRDRGMAIKEDRRRAQADFDEMLRLLKAESFDAQAVEAIMTRQNEEARERRRLAQQAFLEHLTRLPAVERRAMAERLAGMVTSRGKDGR